MSRVISRNYKKVVWQYINWEQLIKYIVNLKSRLYKAFLDKSKEKIYQLQITLIHSQIFIIVALKNSINCCHFHDNSFEIGYIIFCLNHAIDIDVDFFDFYRQTYIFNFSVIIKDLLDQVKCSLLGWLLEPYSNYLFYINNLSYGQFYKLDTLYYCQRYNLSGYALYLSLGSCINYLNLHAFLDKLDLINAVKVYCYKYLGCSVFSTLSLYLDYSNNYKVIKKNIILYSLKF